MEIVALSGYARSGKDTAADVLVNEFGYTRVAFADKLREVLYELNPLVSPTSEKYFVNPKTPMRLQEVIDNVGWDGYKDTVFGSEIRRLLQRMGTEAGRETLWDSIWIDAAFTNVADDAKIVITDCRFSNEAQAIEKRGGKIWRVKRLGVGPANSHPSETLLNNWNFYLTIHNDGSLEEFCNKVRARLERTIVLQ